MNNEQLDELAEAARNRGLKLVRSRVRTPNKQRFGTVGLTDKAGKAVFGMDLKGPSASPEEVEDYLRNLGARDWGASLDVAVLPRQRKEAKARREAANDAEAGPAPGWSGEARSGPKPGSATGGLPKEPPPGKPMVHPKSKAPARPAPVPQPKVRDAKQGDVPRLLELISDLGHELDEKSLRKTLKALETTGEPPLVATLDRNVVGLCGVGVQIVVHRAAPLGRITILAVAKEAQGRGIGRMLVEAAEKWMRRKGCVLLEVTSNDRLAAAHAFYRHLGFERTSIRFAKKL